MLVSKDFILTVWLLLGIFTILHYISPPTLQWAHDLLRRAYYLPIVIAAIRSGLWGGIITTCGVTVLYLPHAFLHQHHFDPADTLEKLLEIVLYFVVAAVAGYLSDLECRRRIQLTRAVEQQKSLTAQLARAGRLAALGEVVAGIAHEIKNPLHALAGTAEVIDPEITADGPVRRMWEIHKSEIARLRRTAETFLSFARPAPIASVRLNLAEVASRLSDLVAAQTRQNNIELQLRLPDSPVWIHGDMDQLAQVALNITLNAVKAVGDTGGIIRVSVGTEVAQHQRHAYLRIENNGPRIPNEDREHLFDPFHSGSDGTGLGLSISDRIIRQHDGFISVTDGELGVSFTVYLAPANSVV